MDLGQPKTDGQHQIYPCGCAHWNCPEHMDEKPSGGTVVVAVPCPGTQADRDRGHCTHPPRLAPAHDPAGDDCALGGPDWKTAPECEAAVVEQAFQEFVEPYDDGKAEDALSGFGMSVVPARSAFVAGWNACLKKAKL